MDIGVHMLDAAIWLTGNTDVKSVCAMTTKNHAEEIGDLAKSGALTGHIDSVRKFHPEEMDVEDFSAGCVKFNNGAIMTFKVAWATNMPEEASLKLINKRVGINIPTGEVYSGMDGVEKLDAEELEYEGHFPGHCYLRKNLRDVLKNGAEPCVKPRETIACSEIIEAFYRSAELGKEFFISEL